MDLGVVFVWVYVVGVVVSTAVIRVRAGTGLRYRLRVFGPDGFGLAWVLTGILSSMAWPVALTVWLVRGRPEPRIVFNHRAVERRRRQAAGG